MPINCPAWHVGPSGCMLVTSAQDEIGRVRLHEGWHSYTYAPGTSSVGLDRTQCMHGWGDTDVYFL